MPNLIDLNNYAKTSQVPNLTTLGTVATQIQTAMNLNASSFSISFAAKMVPIFIVRANADRPSIVWCFAESTSKMSLAIYAMDWKGNTGVNDDVVLAVRVHKSMPAEYGDGFTSSTSCMMLW